METIDPAKAARVWQRVKGETDAEPPEQYLTQMIAREWTDAAIYLQLSRRFQGKHSATLRRMYEQEQAHTACLKGIYTLITGKRPVVKATQPAPAEPEQLLRRCYGSKMHCLAQYEKRSSHPEYGAVFSRMAQQEREHCQQLLELLGSLEKK